MVTMLKRMMLYISNGDGVVGYCHRSINRARLVLLVNPSEIENTYLEHTYLLNLYISGEPCGPFEARVMVQMSQVNQSSGLA